MRNSSSPLVTVAIPVYCGEKCIEEAIISVLSQTYSNFEILILDNCSEDKTQQIVSGFTDSRIRYIKNEVNVGAEGNWNKCLHLCKGKYLKILPHDDLLDRNCLEKQVEVMESDKDEKIALVFCSSRIVNDGGNTIFNRRLLGVKPGLLNSRYLRKMCLVRGTNLIGEPGAVLFRSNLIEGVGLFDGSIPYLIDLDYWFRLLQQGDAYFIENHLSSFRVSASSWSFAIGSKQASQFIKFSKKKRQQDSLDVTNFNFLISHLTARLNGVARLLFYKFYVK